TDYWGVVRALMGLFISTDGQPNGAGQTKEAKAAVGRLTRARELQESLSGLAQHHEAQQRDADQSEVAKAIKARNDAIRGDTPAGENDFPELKEPDLVLASAAGVNVAAERSAHIASNEDIAVTSGRHVGLAVGHSLFASVSNAFSLFVHKAGMKLIAAAGKVHIEAQTDGIDVKAKQSVKIESTTDSIHLYAAKEILLHAGSTQMRISDKGYTVHTAGEHTVHAASHQTVEPQAKPVKMPLTDIKDAKVAEHFVLPDGGSGIAMAEQRYRITLDDGQVIEGISNEHGETSLVASKSFKIAKLALLREDGTVHSIFRAGITRDANSSFGAKGDQQ
ncbi:DUF2345 domain-containing protein, partial [Burkholderia vietnamiensis]|uniref:DUF2345 domain-containing protein n=2 Tax=Burkholderia vietnamiensis TaxID=60552 RepID=UPI0024AEFCEC